MAKITLEAVISATSKGLQTAIEKAKQTVQTASTRMKQAISSIGDAFRPAIDSSRRLGDEMQKTSGKIDDAAKSVKSAEMGKQIMSGLTGMAGKVGIIVAGFRMLGKVIWDEFLQPMLMAKKTMAEVAGAASKANAGTLQQRMQIVDRREEELKKFAELVEANKTAPSNTTSFNLIQQQRKIKDRYGLDVYESNIQDILKAEMPEARDRKREMIKGQIESLKAEEKSINDWLNSALGKRGPQTAERARLDEIKSEIQALTLQGNELAKTDPYREFAGAMRARSLDRADARRKEAEQKGAAFAAYERSQTDTDLQAKVRAAMERYRQAVEDGIDPARAKAAAERDIAAAMDSRYREYLSEVQRRGEALKTARQKELDAQNKVIQAQNSLAEAIQAQADNERQERRRTRDKKRDKLQERLEKAQDRAENAPRRRERKQAEREVKVLQKRIARIDRKNEKEDRQEEKRQSRQRRQQLQRNVDNARRQRNMAGSDADKARATRQQRQREQEALRRPGDVRERLRGQAGGVIRQYGNLTAPGIGGNFEAIATAYTGQLDQIHRDLKDMQKRAYIVR